MSDLDTAASEIAAQVPEEREITEAEIRNRLEEFVELHVSLDEAKQTVKRDLGITESASSQAFDSVPELIEAAQGADKDDIVWGNGLTVTAEIGHLHELSEAQEDYWAYVARVFNDKGQWRLDIYHSAELPSEELSVGDVITFDAIGATWSEYESAYILRTSGPENPTTVTIESDHEGFGAFEETISGTVVGVQGDTNGLLKVCGICGRPLNKRGECEEHGQVDDTEFDLRLHPIVDTGESVRAVELDQRRTEALTGITIDKALDMVDINSDVVGQEMERVIHGANYEFTFKPLRGRPVKEFHRVDPKSSISSATIRERFNDITVAGGDPQVSLQRDNDRPDPDPSLQIEGRHPAVRAPIAEIQDIETVFRLFDKEQSPKYALLPTGVRANRLLVFGTLMEIEDEETKAGTRYRLKVNDGGDENLYAYAGPFDDDLKARVSQFEPPEQVAVVLKADVIDSDDQEGTLVTFQVDSVSRVNDIDRKVWVIETLQQIVERLETFTDRIETDPQNDVEGAKKRRVEDAHLALDVYGTPNVDDLQEYIAQVSENVLTDD